MKRVVNSLLIAAAIGIGLTAGLVFRRMFASVPPRSELSVAATLPAISNATSSRDFVRRSAVRHDDSPLATKLEKDLSMSRGVTRWLYWLARREPYFQSAVRSLAYHHQAAEQFGAMNATDRVAARKVIETMNLPEDRRANLLSVLKH